MSIQKLTIATQNLKSNWFFPLSAMAFFRLFAIHTLEYYFGMLLSFIVLFIVSSQIASIKNFAKCTSKVLRIISLLTALGVCLVGQKKYYDTWKYHFRFIVIKTETPLSIDLAGFLSLFVMSLSLYFAYCCITMFWKSMTQLIAESGILKDLRSAELTIYSILFFATLVLILYSFSKTNAFYGATHWYDVIYSSDSSALVKQNAYLVLTHAENDLRQPLFAVFAAPFVGIPYLIGRLFDVSATVQAMLTNCVQVAMLYFANLMLCKVMKLTTLKRICFMLLTSCTYTHLLFTLMMEQYIVAYFWLTLCLYTICEQKTFQRLVLWGGCGSMLTTMALLPFTSDNSPLKDFKKWFADMIKPGLGFLVTMLAFCRFDVIFNLSNKVTTLTKFTGKTVSIEDKIYQYTHFIRNCFVAPDAGITFSADDRISWQLNTMTGVSVTGIILLLLAIVSAILNKNKKSSQLAAFWVCFSVIMLFFLGWGTKENGLILYALYFGWAFLVLLFQLIEKLETMLNIRFLLPVLSIGCSVIFAIINIPAITDVIDFAITYFPA